MEAEPKQLGSTSLTSIAYNPFMFQIDRIEAHGQLSVEEKEDQFRLKKEQRTILEISKEGYWLPISIKRRFGGLLGNRNDIQLNSNNPDVVVCYEKEGPCRREFTRDIKRIRIRPSFDLDLKDLAKAAGVLDQEVRATLLNFDFEGTIDGQPFTVMGRIIYDNTAEAKSAFWEEIRSKQRVSNMLRRIGKPVAILMILVVPFIWLGMKKSQR